MEFLPPALSGLAAYPQFVLYRTRPDPHKPGKLQKFPVNHQGEAIDAHDSQYWMTAEWAFGWAKHHGGRYGVAFVLSERDPFFFIDIDSCNQNGQWSPIAQTLLSAFAGCAVEVSTSGNGLHILGTGRFPEHMKKNEKLGIELYTEKRFIALTGRDTLGDVNAVAPDNLAEWLVTYYFKPRERVASVEWESGPSPDWDGPRDDDDLIRRASRGVSVAKAMTGGATFADLWTANASVLASSYPPDAGSQSGLAWNGSRADAALALYLAFWTGRDCARIERLMQRSALKREKWEREDYLVDTITNACSICKEVCKDKKVEPVSLAATDAVHSEPVNRVGRRSADVTYTPASRALTGTTYVSPEQQAQMFEGCVLIQKENRAWVPAAGLVNKATFNNIFNGYTFIMDRENNKTTFDAWECFTASRAYRFAKVFDQCFRPDLPSGHLVQVHDDLRVNTYRVPRITRREGDVTPFLRHLEKLLPDHNDRRILIFYLAALVQHRGVKFKWAPVLQGVEGNGKTFISKVAEYAVGKEYTHWPIAKKISNQFNSWMYRKLLYCVEDFGPGAKRDETIEALKPMITGEDMEIEGKGVDQENREVCGNFLFNTNHRGAIRKTINDRRFAVFHTAQQCLADLYRDGMDENYHTDLFEWAEGKGKWAELGRDYGYSCIAQYLENLHIPYELNPAGGCIRAPRTSTTQQAIEDSRGSMEQLILEAVEERRGGFRGDFISSTYLKNLLDDNRMSISPARRDLMMESLGYVPHPALPNGRPLAIVQPDNGRPIIYVRRDSPLIYMADRAEVLALYSHRQQNDDGSY